MVRTGNNRLKLSFSLYRSPNCGTGTMLTINPSLPKIEVTSSAIRCIAKTGLTKRRLRSVALIKCATPIMELRVELERA
jgi:hypothetical protein